MNKKIPGLKFLKEERLNKIISLREKKIKVYRMETREDLKKFILNSIGLFTSFIKLLLSLVKLSI